eukprot:ANDGO_06470.mRNA.1 Glutathione synthetase
MQSAIDLDAVPHLAFLHGLCATGRDGNVQHLPLSVTPSVLPRSEYERAVKMAPAWSILVDRISRDHDFIKRSLEQVVKYDDFTARLLSLLSEKSPQRVQSEVRCGIHRSDYMLDHPTQKLQQIEINTISASFGALSSQHASFMKFLLQKYIGKDAGSKIVLSNSLSSLAKCLSAAVDAHPLLSMHKIVLFVVQPNERNFADQRFVELELFNVYGIRVLRKTLEEVHSQMEIDEVGHLRFSSEYAANHQISVPVDPLALRFPVVYYRSGYAPTDYPSEKEWNARKLLECSSAINCPCVAYQLAGTKRIQEVFSSELVFSQFLNVDEAKLLSEHVTEFYPLEEDGPDWLLNMVAADPHSFVLKPQREGGGNLLHGQAMVQFLRAKRDLLGYTLMKRIEPPVQSCVFVRQRTATLVDSVSEYGFFSVFVGNASSAVNAVALNSYGGHIVRSKSAKEEDGGVAAGVAVLDTLVLQD